MRLHYFYLFVSLLLIRLTVPVWLPAQEWTVVNLRPDNASTAQVYSVFNGQQAGIAIIKDRIRAGYWNSTAKSWVNLDSESFALGSTANSIYNDFVVGTTIEIDSKKNDYSRAALWIENALGYVDLHPVGAEQSFAYTNFGEWQGGVARFNESNHAVIWNGSAESYVDLHPMTAIHSYIHGMHSELQVGYATVPLSHASIWQGTAESWIDLHPEVAFASQGWNTDGVQQVGWSIFDNRLFIDHPAVWEGSAESYVDLLPTGWQSGKALGVFEGRQIGYARPTVSDEFRAMVWSGVANEFVDLHAYLPSGKYIRSTGYDIWHDSENWYAVGQAVTEEFVSDPILWITPYILKGDINGDGFINLLDVEPFVTMFFSGTFSAEADINCDGFFNLLDVAPFVVLLASN